MESLFYSLDFIHAILLHTKKFISLSDIKLCDDASINLLNIFSNIQGFAPAEMTNITLVEF